MKSELVLQIKRSVFGGWGEEGCVGPCVSCHGPTFSLGGWTLRQLSWANVQFRGLDPVSAAMGQYSV